MNLSVQRELPVRLYAGGLAYVGRLGRHLLQQTDLATPLDLVDPKSGPGFLYRCDHRSRRKFIQALLLSRMFLTSKTCFLMLPAAGADGSGHGGTATQNIYTDLFQAYPVNASYIQYKPGYSVQSGLRRAHQRTLL